MPVFLYQASRRERKVQMLGFGDDLAGKGFAQGSEFDSPGVSNAPNPCEHREGRNQLTGQPAPLLW